METQFEQKGTRQRSFRGAKILLIEDNPDQIMIIRRVLHQCMPDVQLMVTTTEEETLSQLNFLSETNAYLPRLILLDLYLPALTNGLQLLKQLKGHTSLYRLIPVTVLSCSERPEDVQMSYDLGTNSYIVKPTDYAQWLTYFQSIQQYWWHTVTSPL